MKDNATTIKNVRVFDGEKLTAPTNVVIKDGHICGIGNELPSDSDIIDGEGQTLLPGFFDTHIHIDSRDNCALAVKSGITTFIDQMCDKTELINSLREPDEPITNVRSVYMPVQAQSGKMFIDAIGYEPPYVKTKDDVRRTSSLVLTNGGSYPMASINILPDCACTGI